MQANAQGLQKGFEARDSARLLCGDQLRFGELAPGAAEAAGAADPQHILQIAQPAGAFLEIGFEIEVRIDEARVAFLLLLHLGQIEGTATQVSGQHLMHFHEQGAVAGNQASLQQVSLHRHIRRFGHAVAHGADAVSDLQPNVPQYADQFLQALLQGCIRLLMQQDQQVYVGMGIQLAASIAAHRHQRQLGRHGEHLPYHVQMFVHQFGMGVQLALRLRMKRKILLQRGARCAQA